MGALVGIVSTLNVLAVNVSTTNTFVAIEFTPTHSGDAGWILYYNPHLEDRDTKAAIKGLAVNMLVVNESTLTYCLYVRDMCGSSWQQSVCRRYGRGDRCQQQMDLL